jgi:thiol:disulfide interchange protein
MNQRRQQWRILVLFLGCWCLTEGLSEGLFAAISKTDRTVDVFAVLEPSEVRPGEKLRLVMEVRTAPGWHIYSAVPSEVEDAPPPTRLAVIGDGLIVEGPIYETRPSQRFIPVLKMSIAYHAGRSFLYQNLALSADAVPGDYTAVVQLWYQPCTDRICLPTETRELTVDFQVSPGPIRSEYLTSPQDIDPMPGVSAGGDSLTGMVADGFWAFIALAALMGLASLLTPCVFPMIPITVSFFSKQAEGRPQTVVRLALLFAAGIMVTYTGVGLLISALFGAGSALQLAGNPWINLAIALVFIVFAFSLMGFLTIQLPSGIATYFERQARRLGGGIGVLLMGFTFTLTAFTCTVQFVGAMLIASAQGEWLWPLIGMMVFSGVFALPFFLLAVAPSLIQTLQGKSGPWLGRGKVVLGILELMAAVKFLSNADLIWQTNLLSRNTAIAIWMVLLAVIVAYLLRAALKPAVSRSALQWAVIAGFCLLLVWVGRGWDDRSLGGLIDAVLPPTSGLHQSSGDYASPAEIDSMPWYDNLETALNQARQQGRPIFLEFTGYICVNCRWMEQNVMARRSIHQRLVDEFVLVKLYTDGGKDARRNQDLQINRFQTVALPYYVILSVDNDVIATFPGIARDLPEFQAFLDRAL